MGIRAQNDNSQTDLLDGIIADYLRRKAAGETDLESLLIKAHTNFEIELREFFDNEACIRGFVQPLKSTDADVAINMVAKPSDSKRDDALESTTIVGSSSPVLQGIRYRIHRFHDRGGMGEIWVGHDQRLGRDVAIKILRPERAELRERFQFEAQVSGQLEHPGVVRVYDCDVDIEGRPFYVMQFVRGKTLRDAIQECHAGQLPELEFHRLLETMIDLCHIVAYAHSRGVVHRDIKPVNVMLGAFGETQVLDWGLAKLNDHPELHSRGEQVRSSGSGTTATQDGAVLGSPQYLSPEAAAGRIEEVDHFSDIYLLGATLYEILTGRPPREGSSALEIVDLARNSEPPHPRTLRRSIPKPLDAICRKGMARRKLDRYGDANEMAADLKRYLAREPVSAYSENALERAMRWTRRNRRALGYASTAIALFGIAGFVLHQWRQLNRLNQIAESNRQAQVFRDLVNEANYLITSTDADVEESPYYQTDAGLDLASRAIKLAQSWGAGFSKLTLDSNAADERDQKRQLQSELYGLYLLMIQQRLHQSIAPEIAAEGLKAIDQAKNYATPTRGLRRLEAICFQRLGDLQRAEASNQLADDPRTIVSAWDHFLLGESFRQRARPFDDGHAWAEEQATSSDLDSAIAEFERAEQMEPGNYWAQLQIGRCLMALGKHSEAIRAFDGAIGLRPEASWAYTSRALAFALNGDLDRGILELNQLLQRDKENSSRLYLNRGLLYLMADDKSHALADFDAVMRADEPERLTGAAYYRGLILTQQGNFDRGLTDLNWLLQRDPTFDQGYLARAGVEFALGKKLEALSDIDNYLALQGDSYTLGSWQASFHRGRLILDVIETLGIDKKLRAEFENDALSHFQAAIELGGNSERLYQEVGRLCYLNGNLQGALDAYATGIARCPSAKLHVARGWLLSESAPQQAEEAFQAALKLDPLDAEAEVALGYVQAKSVRTEMAENSAMEAMLVRISDYAILFNLACVYGELAANDDAHHERFERNAIAVLRRALELWKQDGSPVHLSIPVLMDREISGAFRTLRSNPEFNKLR